MTDWYEKSMRALQLAGKGERTQQAYTRSVRKLLEFFDKSPELIRRRSFRTISCTVATSTSGRRTPCASPMRGFAFSSPMSLSATGGF